MTDAANVLDLVTGEITNATSLSSPISHMVTGVAGNYAVFAGG